MKYKVVLFDVDGVVVNPPIISKTLEDHYNLPFSKTKEFFFNEFKKCSKGESKLEIELAPYLDKWNWNLGVDEFIKLWMETSSGLNSLILKIVKNLKNENIKCFLSTNQEKIRTNYLMNEMGLNEHFDGIFSSSMCGFLKPAPEYFEWILKEVNKSSEFNKKDFLLIDDSSKNITAATDFGIDAVLFKDRNYEEIKSSIYT